MKIETLSQINILLQEMKDRMNNYTITTTECIEICEKITELKRRDEE